MTLIHRIVEFASSEEHFLSTESQPRRRKVVVEFSCRIDRQCDVTEFDCMTNEWIRPTELSFHQWNRKHQRRSRSIQTFRDEFYSTNFLSKRNSNSFRIGALALFESKRTFRERRILNSNDDRTSQPRKILGVSSTEPKKSSLQKKRTLATRRSSFSLVAAKLFQTGSNLLL